MYSRIKTLVLQSTIFVLACVGLVSSFTAAQAALVISTGTTAHVTCAHHVCTATSSDAVFNVTKLQNQLANSKMKLVSGGIAGDIVIDAPLTWVSANTLTLDAYHSIIVNQPVAVAGPGGLALTTDDGGTGGVFSFGKTGNVNFWSLSSNLTINGNPYTLVNTVAALASGIAAKPSGNFALAGNYDASADGSYANSPVITSLTGTVQGLGNTISNLSIVVSQAVPYVGLFAEVGTAGTIENVRLMDVNIQLLDTARHTAASGGLAAYNLGLLFGDEVTGSILSRHKATVGGLAGVSISPGTVISSSTDVNIQANGTAGGLVGATNGGEISSSHANGKVKGNIIAGGLVGNNEGPISQSYATGIVKGSSSGGLVGLDQANGVNRGTIVNSYATGAVTGGGAGGLASENDEASATIATSYSTGAATAGAGGFICRLVTGNVTNSYFDETTSGTTEGTCTGNVSGITGLTTAQLQSGLPAGFDPSIWGENPSINGGLPYLIANPSPT